jgi:hypothetical protein
VTTLSNLLAEEAEILAPVALGASPPEAEAVVFPQLFGEAYRHVEAFKAINLPILIITSEFGTVSMWDWEIAAYLKAEGVETLAPYNLEQTQKICRGLGVKRELKHTKFLVFQDNPGEGFQASIFKRFYWWEDECTQRMFEKFGMTIVKKSFKQLGAEARQIPDQAAEAVWQDRSLDTATSQPALNSAIKLYLAVKQELDQDESIAEWGLTASTSPIFPTQPPVWPGICFTRKEV